MATTTIRSRQWWISAVLAVCIMGSGVLAWAGGPAATGTTLAIAAPAGGAATGTTLTLTATVSSSGAAVHPGLVVFCEASDTLCGRLPGGVGELGSAQLSAAGTAVLQVRLGAGAHSLIARFMGTTTEAASTSAPQAVTVAATPKASTLLSITSSGTAPNYALTAVLGNLQNFGSTEPSGSIAFTDTTNANAPLGSVDLAGAQAGWTLAPQADIADGLDQHGSWAGSMPSQIVTADFNHDGIMDFAIADGNAGRIGVYLGKGDGTYQPESLNDVGFQVTGLAVADLNGDGNPDLVAVLPSDTTNTHDVVVAVLLGNGDGTFVNPPPEISVYPGTGYTNQAIVIADFNGDGIPDVAVSAGNSNIVAVILGKGDGTFQAPVTTTVPNASGLWELAAVDLTGNGVMDLAATDAKNGALITLLGNGDGTFTVKGSYPLTDTSSVPRGIAVADFNGDGVPDVAVATQSGIVEVLLGNGDGTLGTPARIVIDTTDQAFGALAAGDFNGDGKADLAVTSNGPDVKTNGSGTAGPGTVQVLIGKGNGAFEAPVSFPSGTAPISIAAADMNGDGLNDIIVGDEGDQIDSSTSVMGLLAGARAQTVTLQNVAVEGPVLNHTVSAAYAGDSGFTGSNSNSISLESIATSVVVGVSGSAQVNANQPVTLTATITPASAVSNVDGTLNAGGVVTFSEGATVLGTGTVSGGVATLTLSFSQPGIHLITASYAGDVNFASSQAAIPLDLAVRPLVAVTATLTAGATQVTLGSAVKMTATVQYGSSPVYPGRVEFCDTAAAACTGSGLLGSAQLTTAGTAAVNLVLDPGTHSIKAVFAGTTAFPAASSGTQTVTVSGPSLTLTGTQFSVSGQPTNYSAHVTLLNAGATGTALPGGEIQILDTSNNNAVLASQPLSGAVSTDQMFTATAEFKPYPYVGAALAVGDVNGDGIPDVVFPATSVLKNGWLLQIMCGDGIGGYASCGTGAAAKMVISLPSTSVITSIAIADVNGDGIADVVVADNGLEQTTSGYDPGPSQVGIFLGNGDGTFGKQVVTGQQTYEANNWFSTGENATPSSLAVADVNGDGIPDIVVANQANSYGTPQFGQGSLGILLGNGDGTFQPVVAYTANAYPNNSPALGAYPVSLAVGDFNGDGKPDAALLMNYNRWGAGNFGAVSVLLNKGDGTFAAPVSYGLAIVYPSWSGTLISPSDALVAADFTGTGHVDLAFTGFPESGSNDELLKVLPGKGDGTFAAQATYDIPNTSTGPLSLAAGDFNGDGKVDLALSGFNADSSQSIELLAGNGDATFQAATTVSPGVPSTGNAHLAAARTTPDGRTDLVEINDRSSDAFLETLINGRGQRLSFTGLSVPGPLAQHNIVASYAGDSTYAPSNSPATTMTSILTRIDQVVADPGNTVYAGESVSLSAAPVGVQYYGSDIPTGTVTYSDNGQTIGSVDLSKISTGLLRTTFSTLGTHQITASYSGDTNFAQSVSQPLTITVEAGITTTTTVSASTSSGTWGQSITYTATVVPSSGTVQGKVEFDDPPYTLCIVDLDSTGTASCSATSLPVGSNQVTATYQGYQNFAGSTSSAITVKITPATTTTTLSASASSLNYGDSETLTATVDSTAGTPNGTVTFLNGSTAIGTATLDNTGKASLTTTALPAGTLSLTASYGGTTDYATSVSTAVQVTVAGASTSAALIASKSSLVYGDSEVLTATVTAAAGTPSGTVTFLDGTASLGTATLDATGKASYTTTALPAGTASLSVRYEGANQFAPSTSAAVQVTVAQAPTTTSLSTSSASVTAGDKVTLTATVQSAAGTPAGTVTFLNGSTSIGTATLDGSGTASLDTTALPVGADSVTASYAANGNFAASASSAVTVTVAAAPTPSYTVTANPSSLTIKAGQSGTTTLTVTPVNGFNGSVSFSCSGLPTGATCSFSPSSVTPANNKPATTTLTVSTTAATAMLHLPGRSATGPLHALLLPFGGLLLFFRRRLCMGSRLAGLVLLFFLAGVLSACGGGGGGPSAGGGGTTPSNPGTPKGTDPITVSATTTVNGSTSQTALLTITITN